MMGFWQPVHLRDYVTHNPPGVTFFLCLLTLAISFMCLSFYSYTHTTLPNPDTVKDWNHLLASFSQFYLCEKTNASSFLDVSSVPPTPMKQENDHSTSVGSTVALLHLRVPLAVTTSSPSGSLKDFGLLTTLTASQLHLGDKESIHLTIEVISGNDDVTCLTISAPTHLLPMTLLPPECPAAERNISTIHVEASNQLPTSSQTCYSVHSKTDPTLTIMLTKEERSVAVRHLLEVSLCLVGVCLMLLVALTLTHSLSRRHHSNGLNLQKEPLIDS